MDTVGIRRSSSYQDHRCLGGVAPCSVTASDVGPLVLDDPPPQLATCLLTDVLYETTAATLGG